MHDCARRPPWSANRTPRTVRKKGQMAGEWVGQLIANQDRVWPQALAAAKPLALDPPIVFVGSGSSYYLAGVAAHVARRLGISAWASPAGEVLTDPEASLLQAASALIVSRSGATSEALLAADAIRTLGRPVVGLTCSPESPLASHVDSLTVLEADDQTVVMVQSFTAMLLWLQASLALTAGTDMAPSFRPGLVAHVLAQTVPAVERLMGPSPRRTIYLGSGVRYGIAREGALKALEMGGGQVLWYQPLEFRHGPWGSVEAGDVIIFLNVRGKATATRATASTDTLVGELAARGATVMEVARTPTGQAAESIVLPEAVPDLWAGPLALVALQHYAWAWSLALGRDPDQPRHLTKVVRLE